MKFFKKHWFFVVLAMALVILSFSFNALASDKEPNTDTANYTVGDCTNAAADEQTATTLATQTAACPTAVNDSDSASCNTSDCLVSADTTPADCTWFKQISDPTVNTKDAAAAATDTTVAKNCSGANCSDCTDCDDCTDCADCTDCSNCADENCSGNKCAANTNCAAKACANDQATEKNKCNSNADTKAAACNPATVTLKTCANLSLDDCLQAVTSAGDYTGLLNQYLGNNCAQNGQAAGNCAPDNGSCPSGNTCTGSSCPTTNNTCPSPATNSSCPYANQ